MKSRIGRLRKDRRDLIYKLDALRRSVNDASYYRFLEMQLEDYKAELSEPEAFEGDQRWARSRIAQLESELSKFREFPPKIVELESKIRAKTRVLKSLGFLRTTPKIRELQDSLREERPSRKRKGWHDTYRPTRDRYWRPTNNNWKRHRGIQYR